MLNENTTTRGMSIVEWLRVSADDSLLERVGAETMRVSLSKGVPCGIRSTIWSQMTRIELGRILCYQSLRDSYPQLREYKSPHLHQIEVDIERT
jgi:hypothetical protein